MIYGLIGERLGHSYSKEIHGELGQPCYEHYELSPEQVEAFVKGEDIRGLNVTIPYKRAVIPFCDTLSESARAIGSVNTLVRGGRGRLHGYNTDYDGFLYMVKRAGISVKGKKALILGTGGTSLTARAALRSLGAGEILIASRRAVLETEATGNSASVPGRPAGTLNGSAARDECPIRAVTYDSLKDHSDCEIIVNTTPVGMYPGNLKSLISLSDFPRCSGVVDVIYNPRLTALMAQAVDRGIPVTGGLPMLVAQAKAAEELFTGREIEDGEVERIIRRLSLSRENIVIVGMPGSGKTSVGTAVAKKLGRELTDIDLAVEKQEGKTIPAIFAQEGEKGFRALEAQMIEEQGKRGGIVITTGGGAVLDERNYLPLKQNGVIFQLTRPLEALPVDGRPLSQNLETLKEMYLRRRPRYERFADCTVDNSGSVEEAAEQIIRLFQSGKYGL